MTDYTTWDSAPKGLLDFNLFAPVVHRGYVYTEM